VCWATDHKQRLLDEVREMPHLGKVWVLVSADDHHDPGIDRRIERQINQLGHERIHNGRRADQCLLELIDDQQLDAWQVKVLEPGREWAATFAAGPQTAIGYMKRNVHNAATMSLARRRRPGCTPSR
jgi:hypothetical protein